MGTQYVCFYGEIIKVVPNIPDKKRNATLMTNQLSRRPHMIEGCRLYQCKHLSVTVALNIFCNEGSKMCRRKLAINQVGVKL